MSETEVKKELKETPPSHLISLPTVDRLSKAISITGPFEGRGFDQVTGNFDGVGLSLGFLQWNLGTGSLQNVLLRPFIEHYGSIDELGIFPGPIDFVAKMNGKDAVHWATTTCLYGKDFKTVKGPWARAFQKWLVLPEMILIQRAGIKGIGNKAEELARTDLLSASLRAFCFAFDVITQNGSMKGVKLQRPDVDQALKHVDNDGGTSRDVWRKAILSDSRNDEQIALFNTAVARAKLARPEYVQDVIYRKGGIALGTVFFRKQLFKFNL